MFETKHSCSQDKSSNKDKKMLTKNYSAKLIKKNNENIIGKDLNKTFFNNIDLLSSNSKKKNNQIINNIPRFNSDNINTYTNNLISQNYSLISTKKTKNYLLKKRLFEDNEKLNNLYGNVFKQSYSDFLNFEIDDNDTTINYLKYKSIPKTAYKVLDAPNLRDDFYLHLLDWSKNDILAVGLDNSLYIWNGSVSLICKLIKNNNNNNLENVNDYYSSIAYNCDSSFLISGTNRGNISIWDEVTLKEKVNFLNFNERIGVIAPFNLNPNLFSCGSSDMNIKTFDIRTPEKEINCFKGHKQEVCGLKWSLDDRRLASGGNDNKLFIWNSAKNEKENKLSAHKSAVKALDWSPYRFGYLLSGGGAQDRTLKFWNINTMTLVDSIDTCSQICNIAFSKNSNEFVSTHGYSENYILVWDAVNMDVKATLKGHKDRVIYMALGPDSKRIVTGAGDETIRFWEVFGFDNKKKNNIKNIDINNIEKSLFDNNGKSFEIR
jgi:WD40 repeat protein